MLGVPGLAIAIILCLTGCLAYHDDDLDLRPNLPVGCYREPTTKPCGGDVVFRWYYDKYSDSCKVFPYRGCRDNGNNFMSRRECKEICIKSSGHPPPAAFTKWSRPDSMDQMYGEPNMNSVSEKTIPFVNNLHTHDLNGDMQQPEQQTPIEARSLFGHNNNYPGMRPVVQNRMYQPPHPFVPPMSPQHHTQHVSVYHYKKTSEVKQVHEQPAQAQQVQAKAAPAVKNGFMADSDMFDVLPAGEKKNMAQQPVQLPQQAQQTQQTQQAQQAQPFTETNFMSDTDIFDRLPKITIPEVKVPVQQKPQAKQAKLVKQSPEYTVSSQKQQQKPNFMPDTEIFDQLPKIPIPEDKTSKPVTGVEDAQQKPESEQNEKPDEEFDIANGDLDDGGLYTDTESAPQCMQFPETGSCRAYIRRWYYDPRKNDCFTFIFGGCDGNKNSFQDKQTCLQTCMDSKQAAMSNVEQSSSSESTEEARPEAKSHNYLGLRNADITEPIHSVQEADRDSREDGESSRDTSSSSESSSENNEDQDRPQKGVINHYYTYHNYGPYHAKHHTYNSASYSGSQESKESESSQESSQEKQEENEGSHEQHVEEEDEKSFIKPRIPFLHDDNDDKQVKNNDIRNISPYPSPLKFFFRILKKLRPRNSLMMMKPQGDSKPVIQSYHRKTPTGGISMIKMTFGKKLSPDRQGRFNVMRSSAPDMRDSFMTNIIRSPPPMRNDMSPFSPVFDHGPPSPFEHDRPIHDHDGPPSPFEHDHPIHDHDGPMLPLHPEGKAFPFHHHHRDMMPRDHIMQDRFLDAPPEGQQEFSIFNLMPFLLAKQARERAQQAAKKQEPALVEPAHVEPSRGEPNVACLQPRDEGNCPPSVSQPRWYYDQARGTCDIFFYNGCGGNYNRFETFDQCKGVCMVTTPIPPKPEQPKEEPKREEEKKEEERKEEERKAEPVVEKVEVESRKEEEAHPEVHIQPVQHTFSLGHLDARMEYLMVIAIMVLGGLSLIVLVAITTCYMYKKHKLAAKLARIQQTEKIIHAHAYSETPKISVIELPGGNLAAVHAVKSV